MRHLSPLQRSIDQAVWYDRDLDFLFVGRAAEKIWTGRQFLEGLALSCFFHSAYHTVAVKISDLCLCPFDLLLQILVLFFELRMLTFPVIPLPFELNMFCLSQVDYLLGK